MIPVSTLVFACVVWTTRQPMGTISSVMTNPCKAIASAWLGPKFWSFDQMSLTLMALIPGGRGGCFGGEKKSRMRVPKPPKFAPHATANRLLTGRLEEGPGLRNSPRFPRSPEPKEVCVKGASLRSRTLMGRSSRNCRRFDQKSSGTRIFGLPNLGTYAGGVCGADVCAAGAWGLIAEGGTRLLILFGTVYLYFRRTSPAFGIPKR